MSYLCKIFRAFGQLSIWVTGKGALLFLSGLFLAVGHLVGNSPWTAILGLCALVALILDAVISAVFSRMNGITINITAGKDKNNG